MSPIEKKAREQGVCVTWATEGWCEADYEFCGSCKYAHSWPDPAKRERAKKLGVCLNFCDGRECRRVDCEFKHFWPKLRSSQPPVGTPSKPSKRQTSSHNQGLSLREQRKLNGPSHRLRQATKQNVSSKHGRRPASKAAAKAKPAKKMEVFWHGPASLNTPSTVRSVAPSVPRTPMSDATTSSNPMMEFPSLPKAAVQPARIPEQPKPVAPAVQPTPVQTPLAEVIASLPTPAAQPPRIPEHPTPVVPVVQAKPVQAPLAPPAQRARTSVVVDPVTISPELELSVPFQEDFQTATATPSVAGTNMDNMSVTGTESGGSLYQVPIEPCMPPLNVRPPINEPRMLAPIPPQSGMPSQMEFYVKMSGDELQAWQHWKFQMAQGASRAKAVPSPVPSPMVTGNYTNF